MSSVGRQDIHDIFNLLLDRYAKDCLGLDEHAPDAILIARPVVLHLSSLHLIWQCFLITNNPDTRSWFSDHEIWKHYSFHGLNYNPSMFISWLHGNPQGLHCFPVEERSYTKFIQNTSPHVPRSQWHCLSLPQWTFKALPPPSRNLGSIELALLDEPTTSQNIRRSGICCCCTKLWNALFIRN